MKKIWLEKIDTFRWDTKWNNLMREKRGVE